MSNLKFTLIPHVLGLENRGLQATFTNSNGIESSNWFTSPPESLNKNAAMRSYLYDKFSSCESNYQADFIIDQFNKKRSELIEYEENKFMVSKEEHEKMFEKRYNRLKNNLVTTVQEQITNLTEFSKTAQQLNITNIDISNPAKELSDGRHTFKNLYEQRMILSKTIAHAYPEQTIKSWKHHDGTMFDDSFILVFQTPDGDYSYHYKSKFWDDFKVKEVDFAPEYDGHTDQDVNRLNSLSKPSVNTL